MTRSLLTSLAIALAVSTAGAWTTAARAGGQYDLTWHSIDGGGDTSTGGTYVLSGTIGQYDAGTTGAGSFDLDCGFWFSDDTAPPSCVADISGPDGPDGNVDALDFLALIAGWNTPCTVCTADITGPAGVPDGNIDSLDFLLLLSQWGSPGNCATP